MVGLEQLEKELQRLAQQVIELKKQEEEKSEYPKTGETYYYVGTGKYDNELYVREKEYLGSEMDELYLRFCYGSTNKYKVEWITKHINLIDEIEKYTKPFKKDSKNWFFVKRERELDFLFSNDYERGVEWGYFHNIEDIKKIIEQFGKKYISKFLFQPTDENYKAVMEWLEEWEEEHEMVR